MNNEEKRELAREFEGIAKETISNLNWHWFQWHFQHHNVTPFVQSILEACVDCEDKLPGLGRSFLSEICSIGGIDRHLPHYDQILQKLSEVLVLRQLLLSDWPAETTFQHEPTINARGKRPELKVNTPSIEYLFEVKTPALTEHTRQRGENNLQLPGRMLPRDLIEGLDNGKPLTLPRDNPVKDFLIDAEAKFAEFKEANESISILIIVWDDHIFEPITSLVNKASGLLTKNSFYRTDEDTAIDFPNVDAIVLVRHLLYFQDAAAQRPMLERRDAFDFGDANALPSVFISLPNREEVPEAIKCFLRALPLDDPFMQNAAKYRPQELVMWIDV